MNPVNFTSMDSSGAIIDNSSEESNSDWSENEFEAADPENLPLETNVINDTASKKTDNQVFFRDLFLYLYKFWIFYILLKVIFLQIQLFSF